MEDAVSSKLDEIDATLSKAHKALRELFSTLLEVQWVTSALRGVLRPKFLESSPARRAFGDQVKGICDEILVAGSKQVMIWIAGYFDGEIADRLEKILSVGGEVRIITPELEGKGARALKRMIKSYGAKVKIHPLLHARIFYVHRGGLPWGVIIGSGDITSECLSGKRFDAAIWSNHPEVMESTEEFFSRVWEDEGAKDLSKI
jgi:hypothetical protein